MIQIKNFTFGEKDIFLLLYALFLVVASVFKINTSPFKYDSLIAIFIFLLLTRTMVTYANAKSFFYLLLSSLVFSTFLSAYTLLVYLAILLFIVTKTRNV